MPITRSPPPADMRAVLDTYPAVAQTAFETLRDQILAEASRLETGPVTETLKWGQPAFVPPKSQGTTIRLVWSDKTPDHLGLFVHCQTSLVEDWRNRFPQQRFEGNRAMMLPLNALPAAVITQSAFASALTYHRKHSASVNP